MIDTKGILENVKQHNKLTIRVSSIGEGYIEFDTQKDFDNFKKDEERKKFLHLKEESIKSSILIQGVKL